jgi:hypothetical protein
VPWPAARILHATAGEEVVRPKRGGWHLLAVALGPNAGPANAVDAQGTDPCSLCPAEISCKAM